MCPAVPFGVLPIDQTHVGFIDEHACLQRMARSFLPQITARHAVQFIEENRPQLIPDSSVAGAPRAQQFGHRGLRNSRHYASRIKGLRESFSLWEKVARRAG